MNKFLLYMKAVWRRKSPNVEKKKKEKRNVAGAKVYDYENHNSYLEQKHSFGLCRDAKISREQVGT